MDARSSDLGVRIAAARRDFGLTQEECAERAGLGRSALAKIETGARGVGATELARLA
ncbi:MAG: helix-turn-helix transcriptional regulator, partial [bacterium]|nr:helix-turn-helix transcriptional regulator [bacterium]